MQIKDRKSTGARSVLYTDLPLRHPLQGGFSLMRLWEPTISADGSTSW